MKVIKPQKLSFLSRTFEHDRQPYLVTTVLAFFPLDARTLLPEVALWKFAAAELGKDAALDLGMPKARAELLVTGKAYSSGRQPRPAFTVRARIGTIDKTLYVVGDRHWKYRVASDPAPITEMALNWTNAFGGPGYALNPLGRGFAAPDEKDALHFLPNIEDPKSPLTSPRDRPPPAGFGAYDFMWPQRYAKLGTYDEDWLKERYPGFAKDMSLGAFNTAPEDQHIEGSFKEDEAFSLENLHPEKPLLEGRLPGITARCFINQRTVSGEVFREIPLRLETVHFFPNAERGVLLFRGMVRVEDEDAADVLQAVVGAEVPGASKPVEHYRRVLEQRLDRKSGHLFALRDGDLLPPLDPTPRTGPREKDDFAEMEALLATEGLLEKHLRRGAEVERERAKEQLRAHGLDPDRYLPPLAPEEPPPDLEHLHETVERTMVLVEAKKAEADELRRKAEDDARRLCAAQGLDYDKLLEEQRRKAGGPPMFSAKGQLEHLRAMAELGRNAGVELPLVEEQLADPGLEDRLVAVEKQLREVYVKLAHHFPAGAAREEEERRRLREAVVADYSEGKSLADRDFTGADLSGLVLEGADLKDTMLEAVNLAGANLRRVDLSGAVLARADLTGADLTGAKLVGANLGAAKLCGAKVTGSADLTRAVLAKADLTKVDLRGATLEGADFSEAIFADADLREVAASELTFLSSDLSGAKFAGANLEKCNFLEVNVAGVDFSSARLNSAVFLGAKGDGAIFRDAQLDNLRAVRDCSFAGADFRGASLEKANLRGTVLARCDFTEARLSDADLSECDLREAKFYLAIAIGTRFVKADLSKADMFSANLMNAILQRATVHGTCFEAANLFGADLFRIQVDGGTILKDAELGQARFVKARSAHEQG